MGWWFAVAVAVVAILVLYGTWTARRLDRLHVRMDGAAGALELQLRARSAAALAFAESGELDPRAASGIAAAARGAVEAAGGLGHDREICESELSRALRDHAPGGLAGPCGRAVVDEAARAAFARRFFNDAVRDVEIVRGRRVVRWLHLAGRARPPAYFEIDDQPIGAQTELPTQPGSR